MAEQGCGPVQAVMSDNAKCYATSFQFRETLAELGARQILIPPYTPRRNGNIERFFASPDTCSSGDAVAADPALSTRRCQPAMPVRTTNAAPPA